MTDPEDAVRSLPLDKTHLAMEARMGTHGGWAVPTSYRGPLEEASDAIEHGAVIDVSFLSRIRIRGDGALNVLERACTHDVAHQEDDSAELSCLCNASGGIVDLGYLLRRQRDWLWTGDAGNRGKTLEHLAALAEGTDTTITDRTEQTVQLAVVGPEAAERLDACLPFTVSDLPTGHVKCGSLLVARYTASRTAYADTWGLEVIIPAMVADRAWRFITSKAGDNALPPMGVGAREILRIRAGLPRYGHEVNETVDPITAGLARCVHWEHEFLGRDAVANVARRSPSRMLCRLAVTHPKPSSNTSAIPRLGDPLRDPDGVEIGRVTSGTLLGDPPVPMAMGYLSRSVDPDIDIRIETSVGTLPARRIP